MANSIRDKIRRLIGSISSKPRVTISGVNISHCVVGGNLVIGDQVVVDGISIQDLRNVGPVTIIVEGSVELLTVAAGSVTVKGDVGEVETVSGSVEIAGSVHGDVETVSGPVEAAEIHGDIETVSGSVRVRK